MDHLDPVRRKVRSAPVSSPPLPCKLVGGFAVGGLSEVGFAEDSDLLLVVSSQGRGVFDCRSGERVARDDETHDESWYDFGHLKAVGIGPLDGRVIRLSGLLGGALLTCGSDGWSVVTLTLDWPTQSLLLLEPWCSIYQESARFNKLAEESEVRAFGFSETGKSLVIATSSDLTIYHFM